MPGTGGGGGVGTGSGGGVPTGGGGVGTGTGGGTPTGGGQPNRSGLRRARRAPRKVTQKEIATANGTDILKLARRHVGEKYVLGAQAPKNAANYKGPWDCAEFTSWLVYQVSAKLYGCLDDGANPLVADAFTGAWARDAEALGRKISCDEAARTAGAFVLRRPGSAGIRIGHIVVSDGAAGTVEAHSTNKGVIAGTLAGRRWDHGILVPWIAYSEGPLLPAVPDPPEPVLRLLDPVMTGPAVRKVQKQLKAAGFDPGPADGAFGHRTMLAVAAFQRAKGLVADGEVGPLTAKALAK